MVPAKTLPPRVRGVRKALTLSAMQSEEAELRWALSMVRKHEDKLQEAEDRKQRALSGEHFHVKKKSERLRRAHELACKAEARGDFGDTAKVALRSE